MTPEQADTLANEFIDCMVKQTVRDPSTYGDNLKWASRSELRKAFCIHLALVQLKGIKINLRQNNSLSYSELTEDIYSRTNQFMEIGQKEFAFEDEFGKLNLEFDSYTLKFRSSFLAA